MQQQLIIWMILCCSCFILNHDTSIYPYHFLYSIAPETQRRNFDKLYKIINKIKVSVIRLITLYHQMSKIQYGTINSRNRLYSIQVNLTNRQQKTTRQSTLARLKKNINRLSIHHHKTSVDYNEEELERSAQESSNRLFDNRLSERKINKRIYEKNSGLDKKSDEQESHRKYFMRSNYKKNTMQVRHEGINSERKSTIQDSYPHRKYQKSNKGKNSLLSCRQHRLHTIDQISSNDNFSEQKQEIIKGCIASLQNILTDITNKKQNSERKRRSYNKKSIQDILNINKTREAKSEKESKKKCTQTEEREGCSKKSEKKFKRLNSYKQEKERSEYLIPEHQTIKECTDKTSQQKKQQTKIQSSKKMTETQEKGNSHEFKSYIEYIKNKKRQNQMQLVKKLRRNQNLAKKILTTQPDKATKIITLKQNQPKQSKQKGKNKIEEFHKIVQETQKKNTKQNASHISEDKNSISVKTKKIEYNHHKSDNELYELDRGISPIEMSVIEKVNDSSFLSEWGKRVLIEQVKMIEGKISEEMDCNRLTQALIRKKIGQGQRSPIKKERKKQRKMITLSNISGVQQNFPKNFFQ